MAQARNRVPAASGFVAFLDNDRSIGRPAGLDG
jgi:hypothetical protein